MLLPAVMVIEVALAVIMCIGCQGHSYWAITSGPQPTFIDTFANASNSKNTENVPAEF